MQGTQGYAENAEKLVAQYESIRFADVHRDVLHLFPIKPSRVCDIGAGSGRDAAALAGQGHTVVAIEPTEALRNEGLRLHADKTIEWLDDHLPSLDRLRKTGKQFDLILLTAVWMHLGEAERYIGMEALAACLAEGGRISMSLRHGPIPQGRRMFDVTADETIRLAASFGLQHVLRVHREDMLGRSDVHWTFVVLEK